MNPLHVQHKQDLERHGRANGRAFSGAATPSILGEEVPIQTSFASGVRRSVEGLLKVWVGSIMVGSAVLVGRTIMLPSPDCFISVWCNVEFGVASNPDGDEYNDGRISLRAEWAFGSVDLYDVVDEFVIVPKGQPLATEGDGVRYRASFGVVIATTSSVDGSLRFVVNGTATESAFQPYFFNTILPNYLGVTPITLI